MHFIDLVPSKFSHQSPAGTQSRIHSHPPPCWGPLGDSLSSRGLTSGSRSRCSREMLDLIGSGTDFLSDLLMRNNTKHKSLATRNHQDFLFSKNGGVSRQRHCGVTWLRTDRAPAFRALSFACSINMDFRRSSKFISLISVFFLYYFF